MQGEHVIGTMGQQGNGDVVIQEEQQLAQSQACDLVRLLGSEDWRSDPIDRPVLVVAGGRGAGKDVIGKAIRALPRRKRERGPFTKVEYHTLNRTVRSGERLSRRPGSIPATPEQLQDPEKRWALAYMGRAPDTAYFFLDSSFDTSGNPMLHVVDPRALDTLEATGTVPRRLTVLLDVPHEADLLLRAYHRLVIMGELGSRDEEVTPELIKGLRGPVRVRLQRYADEIGAVHSEFTDRTGYDAVFHNGRPGKRSARAAIYGNDGVQSVIDDIAMRVSEFYCRWRDQNGGYEGPAALHHKFVGDLVGVLFDDTLESLAAGSTMDGAVGRAVNRYASEHDLDRATLDRYLVGVQRVRRVGPSSEDPGVLEIELSRTNRGAIKVGDIRAATAASTQPSHPDYHALRMVAAYIEDRLRIRPAYSTSRRNNVTGLKVSLTDRRPHDQEQGQYHAVRLRLMN